jgi:hypothetical protein
MTQQNGANGFRRPPTGACEAEESGLDGRLIEFIVSSQGFEYVER